MNKTTKSICLFEGKKHILEETSHKHDSKDFGNIWMKTSGNSINNLSSKEEKTQMKWYTYTTL